MINAFRVALKDGTNHTFKLEDIASLKFIDTEVNIDEEEYIISEPLTEEENRAGKLLKAARLRADLSFRQLSKLTGIAPSSLNEYERGKTQIPEWRVDILSKVLQIDRNYLL